VAGTFGSIKYEDRRDGTSYNRTRDGRRGRGQELTIYVQVRNGEVLDLERVERMSYEMNKSRDKE
jgi:hypothetical protein